jgi:hypothetical protein
MTSIFSNLFISFCRSWFLVLPALLLEWYLLSLYCRSISVHISIFVSICVHIFSIYVSMSIFLPISVDFCPITFNSSAHFCPYSVPFCPFLSIFKNPSAHGTYCAYCLFMFTSVHFFPFLSTSVHFCPSLSIPVHFCPYFGPFLGFLNPSARGTYCANCPFLFISVYFCPFLSNFCPFLSISVISVHVVS